MCDMKKIVWAVLILLIASCREKYDAPVAATVTGYLVVEGFINYGSNPTVIRLSRTNRLTDTANIVYERSAVVSIEGETNGTYALAETNKGVYTSASIALNSGQRYRLHIKTSTGKEYFSDYSSVRSTPVVDSVSWKRENNGIQFYVNTHDASNTTRYYQWSYDETWEIHSRYPSSLKFFLNTSTNKTDIAYRDPATKAADLSIYRCWQSQSSTNILIGSSEKLSTDAINFPFLSLAKSTEKTSVLYSVNLKQVAVSHEAYLFLEAMKKNTEQLGSIFDAQPTSLQGNIHCVSDPAEIVIGFVEVSQQQEKRIFISPTQVPDWLFISDCGAEAEVTNTSSNIAQLLLGPAVIPTQPGVLTSSGGIASFFVASPVCVDCTLRGSNIKPSFWP